MISSTLLIGIAAGLLLCAFIAGACAWTFRETRRLLHIDERLRSLRRTIESTGEPSERPPPRAQAPASTLRTRTIAALSAFVPLQARERDTLTMQLRNANFVHRDALPVFLCIKALLVLCALIGCTLWLLSHDALPHPILLTLVILIALLSASLAPEMVLRALAQAQQTRLAMALPDAIDLISMCLETGETFERALLRVSNDMAESYPTLGRTLAQMEYRLRLGTSRTETLRELQRTSPVEGMQNLATSLLQSDRHGTPIAQALRTIAQNERHRATVRLSERIERLPVLLTIPTILFFVPGILLLIAGPSMLDLFKSLDAIEFGIR